MLETTKGSEPAESLLRSACARNASVELHYERPDGRLTICRTRLLEYGPEHILAESPQYMPGNKSIPPLREVEVHLLLNKIRYAFYSAIEDTARVVQLNAGTRVHAVALRTPASIRQSQRRAHYRVSLASGELIPVVLVPHHRLIAGACHISGPVIRGSMVDLSAGGVAVLVDIRHKQVFTAQSEFHLSFGLPGVKGEFNLSSVVRHTRVIEASLSLRMGMAFRVYEGVDPVEQQRGIVRFIAARERKMLRRRK